MVEVPLPAPAEGEIMIRRLSAVTCNAFDLHVWQGKPFPNVVAQVSLPHPPGHPGHEWVAEVVELGPGVRELQLGDWVTVCKSREGRDYLGGLNGYASHNVLNASRVLKVTRGVDHAKMAPVEMAMCVGANIMDLKAYDAINGKRTGVIGLGSAGLIAALMLRAEGAAEVVGLDIDQARRDYATAHGIVDVALDPNGADGQALPLRNDSPASLVANPETALDVSMVCTPAVAAAQFMMDRTRDIVSLFATQHAAYEFRAFYVGHHHGLKLFSYPGSSPASSKYAVAMVEEGNLDLSPIVTHTMPFGLEEFIAAMGLIKAQQSLKILFLFDDH